MLKEKAEKAQYLKGSLVFYSSQYGYFLIFFPFPEKYIRLFWKGCLIYNGHSLVHNIFLSKHRQLILKSLWFYAMIKHMVSKQLLPVTDKQPLSTPYDVWGTCLFLLISCCFSGYFTEWMRTNQLQTCTEKAHTFQTAISDYQRLRGQRTPSQCHTQYSSQISLSTALTFLRQLLSDSSQKLLVLSL